MYGIRQNLPSSTNLVLSSGTRGFFLSRDISRCGCASQKPFRAQIFVEFRPMDSESPGTDFPMLAGLWVSREEPGKPGQRNGDRASVHQIHAQRILAYPNVFDAFIGFRCQNTHAMPPERAVPSLLQNCRHCSSSIYFLPSELTFTPHLRLSAAFFSSRERRGRALSGSASPLDRNPNGSRLRNR